jgi:hypothetical protein
LRHLIPNSHLFKPAHQFDSLARLPMSCRQVASASRLYKYVHQVTPPKCLNKVTLYVRSPSQLSNSPHQVDSLSLLSRSARQVSSAAPSHLNDPARQVFNLNHLDYLDSNRLEPSRLVTSIFRSTHVTYLALILSASSRVRDPNAVNSLFPFEGPQFSTQIASSLAPSNFSARLMSLCSP